MRTLVIGLGNPILGDDGVGWYVANRVQNALESRGIAPEQIEVEKLSLGGLSLMERLVGYDHAVIVDAISLGKGPIGSVHQFPLEHLPNPASGHISSAHDTTLLSALEMGRSLGLRLPDHIWVVAIEAQTDYVFSEALTPQVADAVPVAARLVLDTINQLIRS